MKDEQRGGAIAGLLAELRAHGGFTVDHRTAEPVRWGLAVCADPALTVRFPLAAWDHRAVDRWATDRSRHIAAHHLDDVHLGGWHDRQTEWVWLDIVHVLPQGARDRAHAMGIHHRQRAIFDLGQAAVVPLDGPRE